MPAIDLDAVVEQLCQAARDFGFVSSGELHNEKYMEELRYALKRAIRAILEEVRDAS